MITLIKIKTVRKHFNFASKHKETINTRIIYQYQKAILTLAIIYSYQT